MQSYSAFARVYDRIMSVVPYEEWADYLEAHWEKLGHNPDIILDVACGTGTLSCILAGRGYRVIGLDSSPSMIRRAEEKATARGYDISYIEADMRHFSLPQPIDCAVSVFDSINYLLTPEALFAAFRSVFNSLREGGYFIFDLNTRSRIGRIREGTRLYKEEEYLVFWKNRTCRRKGLWTVELDIFLKEEDGILRKYREEHVERGYNIEEVREQLKKAGFGKIDVYEAFTFHPGTDDADRLYFVACKNE